MRDPSETIDPGPRPSDDPTRRRLLSPLPVTERRVAAAGVDTAVLEGGDGQPLVLLHGQGEFAATWGPVLPDLVTTHRVVAPDLPGHGASRVTGEEMGAERAVAWLDALIAAACPQPPALVGHLLGGALALRLALARPERVARLILVDTLGLSKLRPSAGFALATVRFVARPTERSRDRLFRQCFVDFEGLRARQGEHWDDLAAYALERARSPELKAALRPLMREVGAPALPAVDLARIAAPTAMIWGRHDRQVRLAVAEAASARHGWPLHVIEDAADDPAVERPAAFVAALRGALTAA